jgi:hypothetical protein
VSEALWVKEMMELLKGEFGKYYKIPTGELRYITFKLASMLD